VAISVLGVVVTLIGCVAVLLLYAPVAALQAREEKSAFARMTLKLLRMLTWKKTRKRPTMRCMNDHAEPARRGSAGTLHPAYGRLNDSERRTLRDALDDEYCATATYEQIIRDVGL
jgi:hypothetical protein